ncbi:Putative transposase (identified by ISEscan HMM) [Escherichia coli]|nr:Putative transposase (identified by ISEscan HMM) [Escherichia coli]
MALLQIVGGDKLIIPFADGAAHEPIQAGIFSVTSFCGPYAGTANTASVTVSCRCWLNAVNVDHSTIYRWVQRYAPEMRLRWWRNHLPISWMKPT